MTRTWVAFIRHGITGWNQEGRIQGQTDIPLSDVGRAELRGRRVPASFRQARCVASPLVRALETARLLGLADPELEPCLKEMDWGEWEGCTLQDLRARAGADMLQNERRGLDFRPRGGESPREVRARLGSWLERVAQTMEPCVAVTHKGVIRAALSLATGWDMTGEPPLPLEWGCAHVFWVGPDAGLSVREVNVALERKSAG